jgi:hypothetical protein
MLSADKPFYVRPALVIRRAVDGRERIGLGISDGL